MRFLPSIRTGSVRCAALLLVVCTPFVAAADWPDSLKEPAKEVPAEAESFVRASLDNYRAELDAMCRLYEALGGALPSDAEAFFTSATIPRPPEFTIQVSADVLAHPLPTHTDKRPPGIISSLTQRLAHRPNASGANRRALRRQADDFLRRLGISDEGPVDAVLAADEATAGLLDLPHMIYVHTDAATIKLMPGNIGYTKQNADTKPVFSVEWGEGLAGDTNGSLTRLFGDTPGVYEVAAVGYNVFDRAEWKNRLIAKIHVLPRKRFPGPRILVVKATEIGLEGIERENVRPALTALRTPPQGWLFPSGSAEFDPVAYVYTGSQDHEVKISADKVRIRTEGDDFPIRRTQSGALQVDFASARPGETWLRLESAAAGDSALTSTHYQIGLSELRIEIEPEPRGGFFENTDYTVRAVARGGASMDGWQATWKGPFLADLDRGNRWRSTGVSPETAVTGTWGTPMPFAPSGDDACIAATTLRISSTGDKAWTEERLRDALVHGPRVGPRLIAGLLLKSPLPATEKLIEFPTSVNADGTVRPTGAFELYPPAITDIRLKGRTAPGASWRPAPTTVDLFTAENAERAAECRLAFDATFANGVTVRDVDIGPRSVCRVLVTPPHLLSTPGDGVFYCPNTVRNPASCELRAEIVFPLHLHGAISGTEPPSSAPITVRINRLTLDSVRQGEKLTYRLYAFGDNDVSACRARWNVRLLEPHSADAAISRDFRTIGSGQALSTHDMPVTAGVADGYLRSVELVDAEGNTLCTLQAGAALNDPVTVSLYLPESAPPDSRMMAMAYVEHLPPEIAGRVRCRWSVAPATGAFEQNDTLLLPVTEGLYRSSTILRVADSADLAGTRPNVRVELVMGD